MGKIVGGFATSHILFSPTGVEEQADRVADGFLQIRDRIAELKPDAIVLVSADHLNNFTLAVQVTLAVGIADEHTSFGDGGVPVMTFPGHRALGEDLARHAAVRGLDLIQVEEVRPDHGMMIPKYIVDPDNKIPIVPLYVNAAMPIPPSPARCFALGRALKETVDHQRPDDEQIVVLATGGLSHWLCVPGEGDVNAEFDREVIDKIITGNAHQLTRYSTDQVVELAGNGGLEMTAWMVMAGALPNVKGEQLYYEAMPQWITGMGGVALVPEGV